MDDIKLMILFLPANPVDTTWLRLDAEIGEIQSAIRQSKHRDNITTHVEHAPTIKGLRQALLRFPNVPVIIHFAGHGDSDAIYINDDSGHAKALEGVHLRTFFGVFPNIECVVLNSCNSSRIAAMLAEVVPYVVGMETGASDKHAREFAVAFYDGVAAPIPYPDAFKLAKASLALEAGGLATVQPVFFSRQVDVPLHQAATPNPVVLAERFFIRGVSTGVFGIEETQSKLNIRPWKYDRNSRGVSHPYLAAASQGLRVDFTDDEPYRVRSILLEPPFDESLPCGLAFGMSMTAALDLLRNHFEVDSTVGRLECVPRDDRHRNILIVHCPDDRVASVAIVEA